MSQVGSLSAITCAGVAGLSLASLLAIYRLWKQLFDTRRELIKRGTELSILHKSLNAARSEAQVRDEAFAILKKEFEGAKSQLGVVGKLLEGARGQKQAFEHQVKGLTQELQSTKDESLLVKAKHSQTLQLLEARTLELKGAEAFLTKADVLSGADVISMLNALNSEVYQTAAMIAESFEFKGKAKRGDEDESLKTEGYTEDIGEVYASATDILGSRMVESLRSFEHHEDPTLVQIAFQAGIAAYSNWIISSWDFGDPDDERLLGEIYGRLRETEEQAISGRWRALTRAYVQRATDNAPDLAMYFIDAFINILLIAGVSQSQSELQEDIASRFAMRIAVIVKSAQTLRKAIGEDMTSCDFEIIYVAHDTPFDPSRMDDTFAGDVEKGGDHPEPVLCTTDLGLGRVVKVPGRIGEWEETILLRPKIALQSSINEMMAEAEA